MHVQTVDIRAVLLYREGPGDEAKSSSYVYFRQKVPNQRAAA